MARRPRDDPRDRLEVPQEVDDQIPRRMKRRSVYGTDARKVEAQAEYRRREKQAKKDAKALAIIQSIKPGEATSVILERLINYRGENEGKTGLSAIDRFVHTLYEAMQQRDEDGLTSVALKACDLFYRAAFSPEMLKAARQGQNTGQLYAQMEATAASLARAETAKKYATKYADTEAVEPKPEGTPP